MAKTAKIGETIVWHIAPALACAGLQVLIGWLTQGFIFSNAEGIRWVPVLISVAPTLLAYSVLRVFLSGWIAATLVVGATLIVHAASMMKMWATESPLSWGDIRATENYSIITHYLPIPVLVGTIILFAGALLAVARVSRHRSSALVRLIYLCAAMPLATLLFLSHFAEMAPELNSELTGWLAKHDVYYASWDWPRDAEQVGLPVHIIHTSVRHVPANTTSTQLSEYQKLLEKDDPAVRRPSKVIVVLCESCWHDAHNFRDLFDPLRKIGFKELRAISPAFGGQTVNASFELLTGLPANGPLTGVIYQEYGQLFARQVEALPARLKALGYATIAIHNHYRKFWMRDVVKPKLGFEHFISREDMAKDDPSVPTENVFIDDSFLFKAALKTLRTSRSSKLFIFMTTAYTHGPFANRGDDGESDYSVRLNRTIEQVANFSSEVLAEDPAAVLVVVGDHKPGMAEYLQKHGVFSGTKMDQADLGDMPVYVLSRDPDIAKQLEEQAGGRPFFCLSAALNEVLFQVHIPAYGYARSRKICSSFKTIGYSAAVAMFDEWLYHYSLFAPEHGQPVN